MSDGPRRLPPVLHEKIWGAFDLTPWFGHYDTRIGEVWFQDDPPLPLLVKFIFTTGKLSVQVHPNDRQAQAAGLAVGKTEMWHVLRAEAGASLALGFREPVAADVIRRTALSGEIEQLLAWRPVQPGDTFFVPAGTVHAIGAGLAICEIQQNSDTTYRLYDYGRRRELHLEQGVEVSQGLTYQHGVARPEGRAGWQTLVESEYFRTDWVSSAEVLSVDPAVCQLAIVLDGEGEIDGASYRAGECWRIDSGARFKPSKPTRLLKTCVPS